MASVRRGRVTFILSLLNNIKFDKKVPTPAYQIVMNISYDTVDVTEGATSDVTVRSLVRRSHTATSVNIRIYCSAAAGASVQVTL